MTYRKSTLPDLSLVCLMRAARRLAQTTAQRQWHAARDAPTGYPVRDVRRRHRSCSTPPSCTRQDGYNAFDVTRGYLNIRAQMSDRVQLPLHAGRAADDRRQPRSEPGAAPRVRVARREGKDGVQVMFGQHETPWLTFEESVNRYRVLGPFFAERLGLIPGPTDLGASIKATNGRTEVHVGVYNGEGYGQAELDQYKSIDGRATFRPFDEESGVGKVTISGFYQYRLVRARPSAQRGAS